MRVENREMNEDGELSEENDEEKTTKKKTG